MSATLGDHRRRNEAEFLVWGFGRWQVPLSVDGVHIYLPADNRLDYDRFLIGSLSGIQVQKRYAPVLDGPDVSGEAVNLVTRKPGEPFEMEPRGALDGRSGLGDWSAFARAGTRAPLDYLQASLSHLDRDSWSVRGGYTPPPDSFEDGGDSVGSESLGWSVNVNNTLRMEQARGRDLRFGCGRDDRHGRPP